MAFINEQRRRLRLEPRILEHIALRRIPHLRTKYLRIRILHHPSAPSRNTLSTSPFPLNQKFEQILMVQLFLSRLNLPHTAVQRPQPISLLFSPAVESTGQINGRSVRCPFAEHPPPIRLVQPEIQIARCHIRQRQLPALRQFPFPFRRIAVPFLNYFLVRLQPSIIFYQFQRFHCSIDCCPAKVERLFTFCGKKRHFRATASKYKI
ncbi:hypothetical protein Barb4_02031 [Bacteroidales bacterium Barb4]|nr:hypothetical protein Barb4_02031 [Bacteroidales bacterium Barb4]